MAVPIQPLRFLGWLGRQGSRAIATIVFLGIALPPVGRLLKPHVTLAIFVLLCIAFLRIDMNALKCYLRRPFVVILATAWTTIGIPILLGTSCYLLGFNSHLPDLFFGVILQAVAPPMMAAPAFAALMGLDATFVLVSLVMSSALIPFTAPLFAYAFIGPELSISPAALGMKLFLILNGSAVIGIVIRSLIGPHTIEYRKDEINGFNILVLFVFVSALMENIGEQFIADPIAILRLTLPSFAVFGALLVLTAFLFARFGCDLALAVAFMTSQRNMGLMVAATSGALPDMTWTYFALCQFPIYLSPLLLKPLVQSLRKAPKVSV